MASIEKLQIVDLNLDDVEASLLLSDEANWNQIDDDWRLFIRHGKTIGFRTTQGQLIATAAALPYENTFGFISMVLVTEKWRRHGLATRLVDYCIAWLRKKRLVAVLDATKDGAKVYRRQGFNALFELDRWQLNISPDHISDRLQDRGTDNLRDKPIDLQRLTGLDTEAVGASREFLTRDFIARKDTRTFLLPDDTGFAIIRRGSRAFQIGPVIAQSQNDAIELISRIIDVSRGAVFIDVPEKAEQVGLWLKSHGFSIQRSFTRMALDHSQPFGKTGRLLSSAGPEFG